MRVQREIHLFINQLIMELIGLNLVLAFLLLMMLEELVLLLQMIIRTLYMLCLVITVTDIMVFISRVMREIVGVFNQAPQIY